MSGADLAAERRRAMRGKPYALPTMTPKPTVAEEIAALRGTLEALRAPPVVVEHHADPVQLERVTRKRRHANAARAAVGITPKQRRERDALSHELERERCNLGALFVIIAAVFALAIAAPHDNKAPQFTRVEARE